MPRSNRKKISAWVDWKGYDGDKIIVPACVRSPSVRGRNFEVTVKAIAERIPHAIIMLCDTLDTHNLVGKSDDPRKTAIENGNTWWAQMEPVVANYFQSYEIKRWQDVQADQSYHQRLDLIKRIYHTHHEIKAIVDGFARAHNLEQKIRMIQKGLPFNVEEGIQRSVAYLLDEIAGDTIYADWYPDIPEAYNGAYFADINLFNRTNDISPGIDLTIPVTIPVHINRLPAPTIIETCKSLAPSQNAANSNWPILANQKC